MAAWGSRCSSTGRRTVRRSCSCTAGRTRTTLWRHQVAALNEAGYRTIAPDLRGFGASDMPTEVEQYAIAHSVVDMVAVLDALGVERANVVCHDWGAGGGGGVSPPSCPTGCRP